jgi:hypothetical protein
MGSLRSLQKTSKAEIRLGKDYGWMLSYCRSALRKPGQSLSLVPWEPLYYYTESYCYRIEWGTFLLRDVNSYVKGLGFSLHYGYGNNRLNLYVE